MQRAFSSTPPSDRLYGFCESMTTNNSAANMLQVIHPFQLFCLNLPNGFRGERAVLHHKPPFPNRIENRINEQFEDEGGKHTTDDRRGHALHHVRATAQ